MTTTDANEPSYYEIALTNRQVLVAFVLILGSVFGAFLCGVWVGKKGSDTLLANELDGTETAAASELDELESFSFFGDSEREGKKELKKPDLSRLLEEPRTDTTLAEDVGAAREPKTAAPPPPPPPPPTAAPPPSAAPPPPATPPRLAGTPAQEGFIVQVFSSLDQAQARKVRGQLSAGGFTAFIAPLEKDGQTMYRVRIGPYPERAQAERAARDVKAKFELDTWVTAASN